MGAKTSEFALPLPGRRAGLALSKAGWGQAQNHSQRSTARLNQCRPAGMTDLQQGKATIRSWGLHTEPANDTNRRNLQKCYLGISWFSGCDQGSPIESICGPRGEFLKTACNDQCLRTKSRANNFPAVPGPLATAGSSQPEALQGRQGCCTELPSALPA